MQEGGPRIGPYELLSRLGAGGMAETYLARRRGPGGFEQRVCLKRIRGDHRGDPDFVRQFMAEARIAARLRHANIAQVLDFGEDGGQYYLCLELIEGVDLREALELVGGGLDPQLVLYLAIELTTALDIAHRGGSSQAPHAIVHRDVSPSNVLLSGEGEVKLADFGIARAHGTPRHTTTGIVKGKVPYLAPEYARHGTFDPRCDLFALGVLLYECLAGRRPFDGLTDLETLELAARGDHVPVGELTTGAPRPLCEAVERLIEKDPELRFQSAAEVLDALSSLPQPARVRRDLGRLVAQWRALRDSARARQTTASLSPDGAGETEPLKDQRTSAVATASIPQPGLRLRRGPLIALATALAFAGITLAFALSRHEPSATPALNADSRVPEVATSPAVAAKTTPGVSATQPHKEPSSVASGGQAAASMKRVADAGQVQVSPRATSDAVQSVRATGRAASVEVVVVPYGDVFVDGDARGNAPVRLRLAPGTHSIRTNGPASQKAVTVTLAPGQHKRVELQ